MTHDRTTTDGTLASLDDFSSTATAESVKDKIEATATAESNTQETGADASDAASKETPDEDQKPSGPTAADLMEDGAEKNGKPAGEQKDDTSGVRQGRDEKKDAKQGNDTGSTPPALRPVVAPDLRRVVPPGTPEATRLYSKIGRWLWERGLEGFAYQPPPVTKKEYEAHLAKLAAEAQARQEALEKIEKLVDKLRVLARKRRRRIAVRNSKGGSAKSPTAAGLATVLDWAIDMLVLMIDANDNDGSQHLQLAIPRDKTKSLLYVMNHLDQFVSTNQLYDNLSTPDKRGKAVLLVASPPGSIHAFDKDKYILALLQLALMVHSIVMDTGNGNTVPQNEYSVAAATSLVVTALADDPETFEKAISTMTAHYNQGYDALVRRSFIAVSATQPGDTKAMYLEKLQEAVARLKVEDIRNEGDTRPLKTDFTLEDLGITEDKIHLIPFDQHIKARGTADVEMIQLATLVAYLELLVAIFEQDAPEPDLGVKVTLQVVTSPPAQAEGVKKLDGDSPQQSDNPPPPVPTSA